MIFDDKFTSVTPTTESQKIKVWQGLSKKNSMKAYLSFDMNLDDTTWKHIPDQTSA